MNVASRHNNNKIILVSTLLAMFVASTACAETPTSANMEQGTGSEAHVMHLATKHDVAFGALDKNSSTLLSN